MADNVIKLEEGIIIEMVVENVAHTLDNGDLLIRAERRPIAAEYRTHGLNKPGESFDDYCERMRYHEGDCSPRYPLPAIPLRVEWTSWERNDPFHSSITLWTEGRLQAIFDYNFDRCCDFNYECGVYVNRREIEEGIDKYMRGKP